MKVFGLSVIGLSFFGALGAPLAAAQDAPVGVYNQQPSTDAQGYYTTPLPPPSPNTMDYGGPSGGAMSQGHSSEIPQPSYNPPPVSYTPPPAPHFDPIPTTGTNTFGATSTYQKPEKRKRYHQYSPYTDVVMMIRAQEDPNISDFIQSQRAKAREKKEAAFEQRKLRRAEKIEHEKARRAFVREQAVLQPQDPQVRRMAFRQYLSEKQKYKQLKEVDRQGFVQEQRGRKRAQRQLRIEGRKRLMAFQRGQLTRESAQRSIASPKPKENSGSRQ